MVKSDAANSAAGKPARSAAPPPRRADNPEWSRRLSRPSTTPRSSAFLDVAAACEVEAAGYVLLRLPLEVRDLFREWLAANFPDRERRVFALIRQTRGSKDYDATFGKRMTGGGPYARMFRKRFESACARIGLNVSKDAAHNRAFPPAAVRERAAELNHRQRTDRDHLICIVGSLRLR
jgi:hypothetical protein